MSDHMSWLQAIVLGISQGLTEFLPISSSAHEMIINHLVGWKDAGAAFTAITQIGTETAVVIYFRKDIIDIVSKWFQSLTNKELRSHPHAKMGWYVIFGTLPIGFFGVLFKDAIEGSLRNLWIVSATLIIVGVLLWVADVKAKHVKTEEDLNFGESTVFGLGQALALIPGVSRSGATISAGLFMGYKREVAARYAFLLAIPAVFASAIFQMPNISQDEFVNWPATIVATLVAFVVGYVVIAQLMKYLATNTFLPFVIYRIALGFLLIGLLATNTIPAT